MDPMFESCTSQKCLTSREPYWEIVFTLLVYAALVSANAWTSDEEEVTITMPELASQFGYLVQTHEITTEDNYKLMIHRLPSQEKEADGCVVLLQHGLLGSSADWVLSGPGHGLAFILADAGYDVWLGNSRGNTYSLRHRTLDVTDIEFWDFSWHEMGVYDLPATIDYILNTTGQSSFFYIGHSMGTTTFYVMASERPEYTNKVRAMFSLAPMAFLSHVRSPLVQMLSIAYHNVIQMPTILQLIGPHRFQMSTELQSSIDLEPCLDQALNEDICNNTLFLIAGYDSQDMNISVIPNILDQVPAGTSTKVMTHYSQIIMSGKFRQFDYGILGNTEEYLLLKPPTYQLDNVKCPVAIYYSGNDWLVDPQDVKLLSNKLMKVIGTFRVDRELFTHLDFLWAKDAKALVYDKILYQMTHF